MENLNQIRRPKFETISEDIPFMPGWEVAITNSDTPSKIGPYETVNGIHIRKSGDVEDWLSSTLTGAGFIRVMDFVETLIKKYNIKSFVIDACDKKRKRAFSKWALRKGCKIETVKDFFGDDSDIFSVPENF
jgi:hypothetical protein